MAVRLWTHGYDFHAPDRDVLYHLYQQGANKDAKPEFLGYTEERFAVQTRSEQRINRKFGLEDLTSGEPDDRELDNYGLGTRRRIEDYWGFARIDIKKGLSYKLTPLYELGGLKRVPWLSDDPFADLKSDERYWLQNVEEDLEAKLSKPLEPYWPYMVFKPPT